MVAILRARSARIAHAWGASVVPLGASMRITSSWTRAGLPADSLITILDFIADPSPLRGDSRNETPHAPSPCKTEIDSGCRLFCCTWKFDDSAVTEASIWVPQG